MGCEVRGVDRSRARAHEQVEGQRLAFREEPEVGEAREHAGLVGATRAATRHHERAFTA